MRRVFRAKKTNDALKVTSFSAIVVIAVLFVYIGVGSLDSTQEQRQLEIAQDAIVRAAVQCYALESRYPPSLQYMVDNYGLTLDEGKYVYHYRVIGSNMAPEIQVFPRTGGR